MKIKRKQKKKYVASDSYERCYRYSTFSNVFLNYMFVSIYVVEGMINAMGERRGRKTSSI